MSRILVTYASEHGATAEIAQTIARVMRQFDLDVTSRRIEEVKGGIEQYDALVLGTAVYMGEWLEEAKAFLKRHQSTLSNIPVWLFCSGPTGDGKAIDLVGGKAIPESLEALVESIKPREVKVFHGKIDLRRLAQNEREVIKNNDVPRGDYRDWEKVKQWASEVSRALSVQSLANKAETAITKSD